MDSSSQAAEHRRDWGFTLMEILVALAILAVLSAVMLPSLVKQFESASGANLAQDIRAINSGIQNFRENVGRYPSSIYQLYALSSTDTDLCGLTISTTNAAQWRGPYFSLTPINNSTALAAGDARIGLDITRSPVTTSSSTVMDGTGAFSITSVDTLVAANVENVFDGGTSANTTGSVSYVKSGTTTGSSQQGTVTFIFPVRGC